MCALVCVLGCVFVCFSLCLCVSVCWCVLVCIGVCLCVLCVGFVCWSVFVGVCVCVCVCCVCVHAHLRVCVGVRGRMGACARLCPLKQSSNLGHSTLVQHIEYKFGIWNWNIGRTHTRTHVRTHVRTHAPTRTRTHDIIICLHTKYKEDKVYSFKSLLLSQGLKPYLKNNKTENTSFKHKKHISSDVCLSLLTLRVVRGGWGGGWSIRHTYSQFNYELSNEITRN